MLASYLPFYLHGARYERARSIFDVNFDNVSAKLLVFDMDDTLTAYREPISKEVALLLRKLRKKFTVFVLSNDSTAGKRCQTLDIRCKSGANKPVPEELSSILQETSTEPKDCVMIGDRIGTDAWVATQNNVDCIIVQPYSRIFGGTPLPIQIRILRWAEGLR